MNFNLFNILYSGLKRFIFSVAIALNMFSTTAFLIVLSLLGKYEVAADVGIIQGATLAVFMAFSANARNLVLGDKSGQILKQLFEYRLLLLFPLSLVAYVLSKNVIETVSFLALLLILRRCSEWIAELHISERELQNDIGYANNFVFIQLAVFFILVTSAGNEQSSFYQFALLLWAVSPVLQIVPFIRKIISQKNVQETFKLRSFLPHVGSSWIIAISTYVFRVIIVLLAGKAIGGILFSAYAIGGMLNSIYTYALGPSIAMRLANHNVEKERKFTWMSVSFLVISGLLIVLFSLYAFTDIHETEFFIQAIGYSLIGGGIMILAQRKRIHILQLEKESVFVHDVLSNILIIATLPFAFYLLGKDILAVLFLWNAFLAFVFYNLHNIGVIILKITNTSHFIQKIIKRTPIQTFILLLLFFPLFFQLNGNIFNSYDLVFDSKGSLFLLPLPVGVIACFAGIPLLIRYKYVELSAGFIFSFFVLMVFSTLIVSIGDRGNSLAKFIFLLQFVLPAFALLLGQSYVKPESPLLRYESIILFILCIIIPAELIASLGQNREGILTPYLYGFSLYQHLQYLPVIFVGLYFLSAISVYKYKFMRMLLLCLAPFVIVYA
ncbi:MAG: hypothetical protein GTO02_12670, partial [Candidatus Dadabacteria bacterium]|nr:hypothetical protein [Candidatus Dadabacteria bacterium]NIQ15204.1 hypothetical protein [Candidatus Dadabacteria bacterium]